MIDHLPHRLDLELQAVLSTGRTHPTIVLPKPRDSELGVHFFGATSKFTEALLRALPRLGAGVPSLWAYEVANGFRTAQKSQRIGESAAIEFLESLGALPIETVLVPPEATLVEVRFLALRHGLSVHDASYLALARALGVPLGTLDGTGKRMGLKQAAAADDIELVDEQMVAPWLATTA